MLHVDYIWVTKYKTIYNNSNSNNNNNNNNDDDDDDDDDDDENNVFAESMINTCQGYKLKCYGIEEKELEI